MIEAVLNIQIEHRDGPWIADSDHVLTWVVADGAVPEGVRGGFRFWVCSEHKDPDECDHDDKGPFAQYEASFSYIGRPAPPAKDPLGDLLGEWDGESPRG